MRPAIESIKAHLQYVQHQQDIVRAQSNKKNFRKMYKQTLSNQKADWEKERQKRENERRRLQSTCNPSKIRTYACQTGSNTQTVKYVNYLYDMDAGQCLEKISSKQMTCQV